MFSSLPAAWRVMGHVALWFAALLGLGACSFAPPEGLNAVTPFDFSRYEGQWYEMARLDHAFERGLSAVNVSYRAQPDGTVKVINRGFSSQKNDWHQATATAMFTGDSGRASLKLSFFGPFFSAYHVVALDQQHYRWALVVGSSRDHAWILSRDKQLSPALRAQLLGQARQLGIAVESLIWVDQTREDPNFR